MRSSQALISSFIEEDKRMSMLELAPTSAPMAAPQQLRVQLPTVLDASGAGSKKHVLLEVRGSPGLGALGVAH